MLGSHTSQVLDRLIRFSGSKKIVVVGPNILHKDPSSLFFANLLHSIPDSKLVLVDVQGRPQEVPGTFGGLIGNITDFRKLKRLGVPLRFPTSIAMDVRRMGLRDFDLIFDHFTLPFIGGAETVRQVGRRAGSKAIEEALIAYVDAVKPGGKIVLLTDTAYSRKIIAWIKKNRLRHTVRPVDDKYHVWVPPGAIPHVREHFGDAVHSVNPRMRDGNHKITLKPIYECPFMITIRTPIHR